MSDPQTETPNPGTRKRWLIPTVVLTLMATIAGASLLSGSSSAADSAPVYDVKLVQSYPHDTTSFCQGLVVHQGKLLEGTGHYGESRLRLVDLNTGKPSIDIPLSDQIFGEGVTVFGNTAIQLTWKNGYLILYDVRTWKQAGTVRLSQIDRGLYEGWGVTHDGTHLIISDGSATIRYVDPQKWRIVRRIHVKDGRKAIRNLNELEYVNGRIYANIWYDDRIAVINPSTGKVEKYFNMAPLRPKSVKGDREAALNGIAWEPSSNRLFVTGKFWPNVFEIEVPK